MSSPGVPIAYVFWLVDFLRAYGVAPQALLAAAEVDCELLERSQDSVTESEHERLLLAARRLSEEPALGLRLGLGRSFATFDRFGQLLLSAANLREAMCLGIRYQAYLRRFTGRSLILSLHDDATTATLQIDERRDLKALRVLAIEEILGNILVQTGRTLVAPLPVTGLSLAYPEPAHSPVYREVFDCPVAFDDGPTRLRFDAAVLDRRLPQASAGTAAYYARQCERDLNASEDLLARVRTLVATAPAPPPSLTEAAERLAVSPRTLRRQLRALGSRYQRIVDETRCGLAQRYLQDPARNVASVAELLGYREASSFHRAFRRWTGLSPAAYRRSRLR